MSPERFADALNYLDDDLIEQTDDLRQGRRVLHNRPTARQVIRWAAPAACLVLILGVGSRLLPFGETEDSASMGSDFVQFQDGEAPGEAVQDYEAANEGSRHDCAGTEVVQDVSCGNISLYIPENWTYELETGDDESYFIVIRPLYEEGAIRVGYMPNFGVCGTGLTEKEITIAGMKAIAGYYDGSARWSFIVFPETDYVILKDGADAWWSAHAETVDQILETIVFEG